MPHTWKELKDAAIGAFILVALLVGSIVGLHWVERLMGPDTSGMFLGR